MELPFMNLELAFAVVFLFPVTTASQDRTCYFPDGSEAVDDVPCKETSVEGFISCCVRNDICTVAGYCVGSEAVFYRGSCTDQNWNSGLCPKLCAEVSVNSWSDIYPCTPGQFSYDNWTCGGGKCDSSTFHFEPGSLFEPEIAAASEGVIAATTTVTVTHSPTGTTSALPNISSCPTQHGTVVGVGVGLGLGLGISVIAALVGFLIERRKRKAMEKTVKQTQAYSYTQKDLNTYSGGIMAQEADSQILHELGSGQRRP